MVYIMASYKRYLVVIPSCVFYRFFARPHTIFMSENIKVAQVFLKAFGHPVEFVLV
jgi:hypothetical protein